MLHEKYSVIGVLQNWEAAIHQVGDEALNLTILFGPSNEYG